MAEIVVEKETAPRCHHVSSSRSARRRRMELRRVKFDVETQKRLKRSRIYHLNAVENCTSSESDKNYSYLQSKQNSLESPIFSSSKSCIFIPSFGVSSVCGRRRDMEDAVAIHPSFCMKNEYRSPNFHYFGVYDGHGCSHVAKWCKDRLHELVKEELKYEVGSMELLFWKTAMEQSFSRMHEEVLASNQAAVGADCRCELQSPGSDAVGSTAVVAIVTPDEIIVANCGDSRAVLCRDGRAIPLSNDHKPDRPDELLRIQAAGGRVIYWEGARVLGVLAMSRAIGDNYLKPYVSCEPEVTITSRTAEDDCLILASDGLWDVVSNDMACSVARRCLAKGSCKASLMADNVLGGSGSDAAAELGVEAGFEDLDKGCSDASGSLTKLALARRSSDNVSVVVIDLRKNNAAAV